MDETLKMIVSRIKILHDEAAALVPERCVGDTEARLGAIIRQLDMLSTFCHAAIVLSKAWTTMLDAKAWGVIP